jgi:hypothetical protein
LASKSAGGSGGRVEYIRASIGLEVRKEQTVMDFYRYGGSHTPIDPVAGRPKLPNSAFPSLQVFEEEWSLNGYKTMSFLEDRGSEFWLAYSDIRMSSQSKYDFRKGSSRKPALILKLIRFFELGEHGF